MTTVPVACSMLRSIFDSSFAMHYGRPSTDQLGVVGWLRAYDGTGFLAVVPGLDFEEMPGVVGVKYDSPVVSAVLPLVPGGELLAGRRIGYQSANEGCSQLPLADLLDLWGLARPHSGYHRLDS